MKPLHVLQVAEPGVDGVFRHVEGLIHFLWKEGVTVDFAYSSVRGSRNLELLAAEVKQRGGTAIDLKISNAPQGGDWHAVRALDHLIRTRKPDLVHAHSSKAGALTRMLHLTRGGPPVCYTPHAYYGMDNPRRNKARFFLMIERLLAPLAFTLNVSEDEASFARLHVGVQPSRQLINPNGVDTSRFVPANSEERREARRILGLPLDSIILGTVGRMSPQKDPLAACQAVALARKTRDDFIFCHLGHGELETSVREEVNALGLGPCWHHLPYLDQPRGFYAALDGFLMTSRYEGCPIVLMEALSSNLPVITTLCPGVSDFATHGLNGFWTAPVGDVQTLAENIVQWRQKLEVISLVNHREIAVQNFSQESCHQKILGCYFRLLPAYGRLHFQGNPHSESS